MTGSIYEALTSESSDKESKRRILEQFPNELDLMMFANLMGDKDRLPTVDEEIEFEHRRRIYEDFQQCHITEYTTNQLLFLNRTCSLRGIYARLNVIVCFRLDEKATYKGFLIKSPPYGILVDKDQSDLYMLILLDLVSPDVEDDTRFQGFVSISKSEFDEILKNGWPCNNLFDILAFI